MNKRLFLIAFLLFIVTRDLQLSSQISPKVNYWVTFKDKVGTPYSLDSPQAFLTQKSIDRRNKYNILLNRSDLPVAPRYITAIDTIKHVNVIFVSKWLNGLVISIDSAQVAASALQKIRGFLFVSDTSKVKKYNLDLGPEVDSTSVVFLGRPSGVNHNKPFHYGRSESQLTQIGADCLHEKGFRGQGITIAVMDAGFSNVDSGPAFDSIRNNGGILGGRDFVSGGNNPYTGSNHGTMVFSTLAGNIPNVIMGTAPMAKYWLFRTEEGARETLTEEYNWIRAAEFADSVGVDIITTSLGYTQFDIPSQNHSYATLNGRTAPMSIAATMAARKGILVFNSAGNDGGNSWKYVGVPADADSICSVGAVDTLGVYAAFSSVGPTPDGRIKPDLVATGANAMVCDQNNICFKGANGTSFSCPILAGAAACYWQTHPKLNNIQLLQAMKLTASNSANPNNITGWGIPKLCDHHFNFEPYYNSTNQQLTLKLNSLIYETITLDIYDLRGRKLFSENVNADAVNIKVNLTIATDGIYIARLRTSSGTLSKKFLK